MKCEENVCTKHDEDGIGYYKECGGEMVEVGEIDTGKSKSFEQKNEQGITVAYGNKPILVKLYQCPDCKTIKLV